MTLVALSSLPDVFWDQLPVHLSAVETGAGAAQHDISAWLESLAACAGTCVGRKLLLWLVEACAYTRRVGQQCSSQWLQCTSAKRSLRGNFLALPLDCCVVHNCCVVHSTARVRTPQVLSCRRRPLHLPVVRAILHLTWCPTG